ncbi:MAG: NAD(P)/FAD-dependent oxidoreductase [Fidelibacterota bacterium]
MKNMYDIIVVGGGPAGATAAKYAAMGGATVLLLEKDRDIGYPVRCAEGVGSQGLKKFMEPDEEWIANRIDGFRLIAPNGSAVEVVPGDIGYILNRKIFDYELARRAGEVGAHIYTKAYVFDLISKNGRVSGVKVNYMGDTVEVHSEVVIGADGVESRVGRWAGINTVTKLKDMETCVQMTITNINIDKKYCDFYFGRKVAPGGYLWVFPKNENTANVGLGISGNYSKNKSALKYLREFVDWKYPGGSILTTVCGGVPCARTLKRISADGIMLVGDAARQTNPIHGGGIIPAMMAGKLAGEIAAEAIRKGDNSSSILKKYDEKWDKILGRLHRTFYRLKEGIMKLSDDDLNRTADSLKHLPGDEISFFSIFKTALIKQPKLLLDVIKAFSS